MSMQRKEKVKAKKAAEYLAEFVLMKNSGLVCISVQVLMEFFGWTKIPNKLFDRLDEHNITMFFEQSGEYVLLDSDKRVTYVDQLV